MSVDARRRELRLGMLSAVRTGLKLRVINAVIDDLFDQVSLVFSRIYARVWFTLIVENLRWLHMRRSQSLVSTSSRTSVMAYQLRPRCHRALMQN